MAIFTKFSAAALRREAAISLLTILLIPVIAVLIVLYIFSIMAQKFAIALAKIFRPDLSHIFAEPGVLYSLEYIYRRPKVSAVMFYICDGQIPLDHLRRQFEQRIINYCDQNGNSPYSKLRQCWTQFCGFMFWKWEKNFDLNDYIRMYDYTEPELAISSPCTEEDLKRVARTLISRPYVKGRSPWEITVIPNYHYVDIDGENKIGNVLTLRIHHGLADGLSVSQLWYQLFELDFAFPSANFPQLSLLNKVMHFAVEVLKFPHDFARGVMLTRDAPSSWHIVDKKLSRRYVVFASDRIPMSTVKTIKNKYRVGYNTVVYAVTAGAISRLMRQAGQDAPKVMTSLVPYPLPNHPGGLVNHVTATWFWFYPSTSDPVIRFKQIASEIEEPRSLPTLPNTFKWLGKIISALPVPIMRLFNGGHFSMAMTSFPGPEKPLDMMEGVRMVDIISAGGVGPGTTGAVAHCQTIAGYQRIVLTVDELIFQGYSIPSNFNELLNLEIRELLDGDMV